jgi:hypothetical protein
VHDHDGIGEDPEEHEASDREAIRRANHNLARGGVLGAAGAAAVLAYAWWAVGRPPFSATATAAVVLAGVAAMACGALRRRDGRTHVDAPRAGVWAAVALAVGVWQVAAYLQHPRDEHPTLSSLANALLDSHPARAAAFALWLVAAAMLGRR